MLIATVTPDFLLDDDYYEARENLSKDLKLQAVLRIYHACNLIFSKNDFFNGSVYFENSIFSGDEFSSLSQLFNGIKTENDTFVSKEDLIQPWIFDSNGQEYFKNPLKNLFYVNDYRNDSKIKYPTSYGPGANIITSDYLISDKSEYTSKTTYSSTFNIKPQDRFHRGSIVVYNDGTRFVSDRLYEIPPGGISSDILSLTLPYNLKNPSAADGDGELIDYYSTWFSYVNKFIIKPFLKKHSNNKQNETWNAILNLKAPAYDVSSEEIDSNVDEYKKYFDYRFDTLHVDDDELMENSVDDILVLLELAENGKIHKVFPKYLHTFNNDIDTDIEKCHRFLYIYDSDKRGNPKLLREYGINRKEIIKKMRTVNETIFELQNNKINTDEGNSGIDKLLSEKLKKEEDKLDNLLKEFEDYSEESVFYSEETRKKILDDIQMCNESIGSLNTALDHQNNQLDEQISRLQNESANLSDNLDEIDDEIRKICGGRYL